MDFVLRSFEPSLRLLFAGVAGSEGKQIGMEHLAKLCDFDEWRAFLRGLKFIGPDLTDRDGALCFVNSRMAIVNGQSQKGKERENNLPFEGFLEALVRLAMLKALPTDQEITDSGQADAGAFLRALKEADEAAYKKFLLERRRVWPGEPIAGMELARCVEGLITLIFDIIESRTVGDDDRVLSQAEVSEWVDHNLR